MAWPNTSGWSTPSFVDATNVVMIRDVSPLLLEVLRRDPVLLGRFKVGKAATNRKVEWFERDWVPCQFATGTDITAAVTELTLTSGTYGNEAFFQAGDLIQCVGDTGGATQISYKEVMQVSAVDTSAHTVTVSRAYGGTTNMYTQNSSANVTTQGLVFEKIGWALAENSAPVKDFSRGYGPAKAHYTQIFGFDMDQCGTAQAMNLYNMSD